MANNNQQAASTPQEKIGEVFSAGGTTPPQVTDTRATRKPSQAGSKKVRLPGRRTVNEYPLDGDEVWELAVFGGGSTIFFSLGFWLMGQYISTAQALEIATGIPKDVMASLEADEWWMKHVGLACIVGGIIFVLVGGLKVYRIYSTTEHQR